MLSKLVNPVVLSEEAVAVLKRSRDGMVWPSDATGVWIATSDGESDATDALHKAGLVVERYSIFYKAMMVSITGDGLNVLLAYEAGQRAAEGGAQ